MPEKKTSAPKPAPAAARAAKAGDTVAVHYTGRFPEGEEFDSSEGGDPFTFTLGEGAVIPGFERTVVGMSPGQTKTTRVQPEDGYGARDPELEVEVPRSGFEDEVEVGETVTLKAPEGDEFEAKVLAADDDHVRLDLNHPLAGKVLEFRITLLAIE